MRGAPVAMVSPELHRSRAVGFKKAEKYTAVNARQKTPPIQNTLHQGLRKDVTAPAKTCVRL